MLIQKNKSCTNHAPEYLQLFSQNCYHEQILCVNAYSCLLVTLEYLLDNVL